MKFIRCWYVSYYSDGTITGKNYPQLGKDYLCVYMRTHHSTHAQVSSLWVVVLPFCHVGLRD